MPGKFTSERSEPRAYLSIAGMLLLTAVVAVHVAVWKWKPGLVVLYSPFSLSILAIEILRRMFKMQLLWAMVAGVLFSAICYASVISGITAWNYWFRSDWVDMQGRVVHARPQRAILVDILIKNLIFPLGWFLIAGAIVMLLYTAISIRQNRRANEVVLSRLRHRDSATPIEDPAARNKE